MLETGIASRVRHLRNLHLLWSLGNIGGLGCPFGVVVGSLPGFEGVEAVEGRILLGALDPSRVC
jgi:hypothetical protein